MNDRCDVLVVGGGHAGVEAARAASFLGLDVILLKLPGSLLANMPCNPHVGGSAKGILVREIDALGGIMGRAADVAPLQIKMLNTGKGPGVQCLRAQEDKFGYPRQVEFILRKTTNVRIEDGEAVSFIFEDGRLQGCRLLGGGEIRSKATVLTTGTYLGSAIFRGTERKEEGPDGTSGSYGLGDSLRSLGLRLRRFKTGTPPRVKASTIDFSQGEVQPGMEGELSFSYGSSSYRRLEDQLPCHLIYTRPETLAIVREHLSESSLHNGLMHGIGPRYCPSIEAKVVRFPDKERHQLFLEPEFREGESIYIQGFSTGLGRDVQELLVHSLPGLENAEILKYAYQIEYDCLDSLEFLRTLESKRIPGLYAAGQLIGTSGYEEAAGLGLIAGANAALKILGRDPLLVSREDSYLGVMLDDILTKGTEEPYRLLSSRAEHRLLLRHDNADLRLMEKGHQAGLLFERDYELFLERKGKMERAMNILRETSLSPREDLNAYLLSKGYADVREGHRASSLLARPRIELQALMSFLPEVQILGMDRNSLSMVETEIKYQGYMERERREIERQKVLEGTLLPPTLPYGEMKALSLEARERLSSVKPETLGQASRIYGVNPADITVLLLELKRRGLL